MKIQKLKITFIVLCFACFAVYGWQGSRVQANAGGPPPESTGAPGEQTCAQSGCHAGSAVNSGTGTLTLTGLPANYSPNQEINLTVTLGQAGRSRFGFQVTVIDDQGRKAGDLIATDTSRTFKATGNVGPNVREYINHSFNGTSPSSTNQGAWSFRWKAPAQSVGRVTFYVAGNAANNNGSNSGDLIYTINASLQPAPVLAAVTSVSAASFATGASLSAESISAAFGTGLSQNVAVASTVPLPTELDGTQVVVRDAFGNDRNAPLFFVAPTQINYLIPQGTGPGNATVTVKRSGTDVAQGTVTIETASPALFSANASGQGVAAAIVLRVRNGVQIFENVSTAQNGAQVAIPIDLGPAGDQVYLLLFGSGFRNFLPTSGVSVTVGGTNVPVLGYASVSGFVGLDQCNIGPLPTSLAGRGNVNIVMTAGTKTANTVTVNIK